eukprot:CAMPEP_0175063016 /NCGR_PEP_ID=MMETSP0052_2-20121109/14504_1 /TAXON_ID=51329 ORGANISM="Polytomella parva, Strain SAG 63-3" /NCGR_SAMPLE_ID=MMETSP0052_2 /ASSEMBLY_ACC=CAM_ASM_000194 /LENGTH=44 /DNA_ID= /DNA_START= /DNA_END= /DNA_ORIENTATION=
MLKDVLPSSSSSSSPPSSSSPSPSPSWVLACPEFLRPLAADIFS